MPTPEITCAEVDAQDLDTRYLAGGLAPDLAEAFEQHFFGCDRCWALVQGGLDVRAAAATRAAATRRTPRVLSTWWPLAAAASVAVVAFGIWRWTGGEGGEGGENAGQGETERGGADSVAVTPGTTATALTAAWTRLPAADRYRVRLFTVDGTVLAERELTDTSVTIATATLPPDFPEAYWKVQALDRLGHEIASSRLRRAVVPPSRR